MGSAICWKTLTLLGIAAFPQHLYNPLVCLPVHLFVESFASSPFACLPLARSPFVCLPFARTLFAARCSPFPRTPFAARPPVYPFATDLLSADPLSVHCFRSPFVYRFLSAVLFAVLHAWEDASASSMATGSQRDPRGRQWASMESGKLEDVALYLFC
ncbi:hypothetical protein HOY80DRAFT_1005331 [Tuber brumale]|nr:hypothetical protein HOY80DRAFT_1005331 [Tuber brumale]